MDWLPCDNCELWSRDDRFGIFLSPKGCYAFDFSTKDSSPDYDGCEEAKRWCEDRIDLLVVEG